MAPRQALVGASCDPKHSVSGAQQGDEVSRDRGATLCHWKRELLSSIGLIAARVAGQPRQKSLSASSEGGRTEGASAATERRLIDGFPFLLQRRQQGSWKTHNSSWQ